MFGSKPGLGRIRFLLGRLGHPERRYKCVLVAGTNGKGSTAAMLASILTASGKKTGSYFSPSVFSFRERIQIDGKPVSKAEFARAAEEVFALLPPPASARAAIRPHPFAADPPTFFEVVTAMAFLLFSKKNVDHAVLEVGLGGRLDATNVCDPILSIITSIGLEHTDLLGKTTAAIAREKAGILRAAKPVVCAAQDPAARAAIARAARARRSPLRFLSPRAIARSTASLRLRAPGSFQRANAACAREAARLLGVGSDISRRALSRFAMPARWQTLAPGRPGLQAGPRILIDCAHNPPAARAIQPDLARDFAPRPRSKRVLLFAAMKDKDYSSVLTLLAPHFDAAVLCRPPYARAESAATLARAARAPFSQGRPDAPIRAVPDPDRALAQAKTLAGNKGRILVCGSMYLLQYLFGEREFRLTY